MLAVVSAHEPPEVNCIPNWISDWLISQHLYFANQSELIFQLFRFTSLPRITQHGRQSCLKSVWGDIGPKLSKGGWKESGTCRRDIPPPPYYNASDWFKNWYLIWFDQSAGSSQGVDQFLFIFRYQTLSLADAWLRVRNYMQNCNKFGQKVI